MTIDELIAACESNMTTGGDVILLTLPPPPGNGYTMRLLGKRGPRGEIVCTDQQSGHSVVRFKASAVLKFIKREQSP